MIGLVLPGGGARGAYQVGVLAAIAEFVPDGVNPFGVITGASVGSINAASIASQANNYKAGAARLAQMWSGLHADNVYRTDMREISRTALRWLATLSIGGMGGANPTSLLNNAPLSDTLSSSLDFSEIQSSIRAGALRAVGITASGYSRGRAVTFFQGVKEVKEWSRARREGVRTHLGVKHLMGSSSLPFLFPPQLIGREHFGDGSLRLTSPLSPAIHLGAEKIMVIGARDKKPDRLPGTSIELEAPSLGSLAGYMLDLLFLDNLQSDIERLDRVNQTLSLLSPAQMKNTRLRQIDILTIEPSKDLRTIAGRHADDIPWTIRKLLSGVGAWDKEWRLASYLLFEPSYTGELIALGYKDAKKKEADIRGLLE